MVDSPYESLMRRRTEIIQHASGVDYSTFTNGPLVLDYEALMASTGYTPDQVRQVQSAGGVGATPMLELHNITTVVREHSRKGFGARIFIKDEAANPSGSFKDRRAALPVHQAATSGFHGVVAATSGNYGAAVASQAARAGLKAIVVQEGVR